jgi:Leucine-rich repeat (LRR) protein
LNNLPQYLTTLYCNNNKIVSLDNLSIRSQRRRKDDVEGCYAPQSPQTLTILSCNNNQIISLNNLPQSLTVLNCSNNKLTNEIMEIIENNTTQEAISILVEKSLIYIDNSYILK